ncbi:ABC transporter permease [Clostridium paridis]|uniref:ABC transporter permease n=1 Tax=Clostridium paridis TaxID=2803863 RepID=A0A937K6A3_9CLOT|nr:ABC transporter permease [Clostridium paridis]MBL4933405.1 ABC transporter permease [Clostridium paridis]
MSEFFYLVRKNLKLIFNSKLIIAQLLIPVAATLAFIKLFSSMGGTLNYGVMDLDKTTSSKYVIEGTKVNKGNITYFESESELDQKIKNREIDGAYIIPKGFEDAILKGTDNKISIIMGSDSSLKNSLQSSINDKSGTLTQMAQGAKGIKETYYKIMDESGNKIISVNQYNLEDKKYDFQVTQMSVGILIFFMMIRASATSDIMLEEKRSNCYSRIFASPVTPLKFIGANILANLSILLIQMLLTVFFMEWVFKITTGVPMPMLLFALLLISLVAIAFTTMMGIAIKDDKVSGLVSNLLMNVSCMVSGCFVPVEWIPQNIRSISYVFPQSWVMDILEKYQNGIGDFKDILINIITLIAFIGTFLVIAAYKIKYSNKEMSLVGE